VPYDYYRYPKYALQRFADATGFEAIFIKEIGAHLRLSWTSIVVDILAKHLTSIRRSLGRYSSPSRLSKAARHPLRCNVIKGDCESVSSRLLHDGAQDPGTPGNSRRKRNLLAKTVGSVVGSASTAEPEPISSLF
jgi:hypothetical protein